MRLGDADLRIRPRAHLARELERDDPRDVGLQREHLQIEHQLRVLFPVRRHADRPRQHVRQRIAVLLLGLLDAPLDLAQRVEILVHARCDRSGPSRAPSRAMSSVTQSRMLPFFRSSALRSAAVPPSPNSRSNTTRGFASVGSGVVLRRPRERVHVHAVEAVVAVADDVVEVGRELERRQRRLLAELLRGDLIDRDAHLVVGAFGQLRLHAAQERAVRGRVIARRIGVLQLEVAQHRSGASERHQRRQRRRELGEAALPACGIHSAMFDPIGI